MVIGSLGFETTIREGGSNLTVDMHAYGWRKEGFYPHVRKTGAAREVGTSSGNATPRGFLADHWRLR